MHIERYRKKRDKTLHGRKSCSFTRSSHNHVRSICKNFTDRSLSNAANSFLEFSNHCRFPERNSSCEALFTTLTDVITITQKLRDEFCELLFLRHSTEQHSMRLFGYASCSSICCILCEGGPTDSLSVKRIG